MRRRLDVFTNREELELLQQDPSLLLIADAYSMTQGATPWLRECLSSLRVRGAVAMVASAAAVSVLLVSSISERGVTLTDKALAAVGPGPVLHVVTEVRYPGETVVDLSTGAERPSLLEDECWSDADQHVLRCVTRRNGIVQDLMLASRGNATTSAGSIVTNGRPQDLNPVLADFADRYQIALESGKALEIGRGDLYGRPVAWLEIQESPTSPRERVAVDNESYKPVAYGYVGPDGRLGPLFAVSSIESMSRDAAPDLTEPVPVVQPPTIGGVQGSRSVGIDAAANVFGGDMLVAGTGSRLVDVDLEDLRTGYGKDVPPSTGLGARLVYRIASAGGGQAESAPEVTVRESHTPQLAYQFPTNSTGTASLVPLGNALVDSIGDRVTAFLNGDHVYVSVTGVDKATVLSVARTLKPVR